MGQTSISQRPLDGVEEFDRRMRSIAQSNSAHADAMAELARLVGQRDPFITSPEDEPEPLAPAPAAADPGEEPGTPVEPAVVRPAVGSPALPSAVDLQTWERSVSPYPSISIKDEPIPDRWADALDDDPAQAPPVVATRDALPPEPGESRRTLTVLAAVVVLTAGGLGASFLARPSSSALVTTAAATPTIMAATGPTKIQPEPVAAGADAPSEPSTLLDKSNSDGTATAKVVSSAEQPVDLSQAVKPAPVATDESPAPRPSAFPEARKVKTVMVRPDGSIVANAVPSAAAMPADAAASAASQQASLAFDPKTALPPPPAAVRQPSAVDAAIAATAAPPVDAAQDVPARTPSGKATARATPHPVPSTSQEGVAQGRTAVATPKSKPPVPHPAKPKPAAAAAQETTDPVQVASTETTPPAAATDADPTSAIGGGSFAIQLGAAQSQADGSAAAARLGQKYAADLGGLKPSVVKAQAGGKTVFRIRVGNLSQDGANALCGKVKAGGGGCFVARN